MKNKLDDDDINKIIKVIESQSFKIAGEKLRLCVLGIYPQTSVEEDNQNVSIRLGLTLDNNSKLDIFERSSVQARLLEIGFTYPLDISKNLERQVDKLIIYVKQDAPRVIERSKSPKIVFIDPVSPQLKGIAGFVGLLVAFGVAILFPLEELIPQKPAGQILNALVSISIAVMIYKLITLRYRVK